jgi:S1-C subfamily serine protease
MKSNHLIAQCSIAALVAGCVSPSQMLVGPQGDVRRCAANGWGYVGAPLAEHSVHNCVDDMQRLGYVPVEKAGAIGVLLSDSAPNSVTVAFISPDSPASKAGLLIGDRVIKVNGQQVLSQAAARAMMFGKVGESISLTIERNGGEKDFQIQRGAVIAPDQTSAPKS